MTERNLTGTMEGLEIIMTDLSVAVKTSLEDGVNFNLVFTHNQREAIKSGLITMCLMADETKDKPEEYDFEFLKGFILNASDEELLQFVYEIKKEMVLTDTIEDFIEKFENPEEDSFERAIRVIKRIKEEMGFIIDADGLKRKMQSLYSKYQSGDITRREFGNTAMYNIFKELSNKTFVDLLFFNTL